MKNKDLLVAALQNGSVIDHIPTDKLFTIARLLELEKFVEPVTIGNNLGFYINDELLQLRRDGFVGQPLSDKLGDGDSEVWYGSLSNGNYVVALFNRGDQTTTKTIAMSQLGISGEWKVRDLWQHADEGMTSTLSATLPAHGCKVVMLTK